jgi:hypothetical protein
MTERVLSVSARNIPREYELTYRVEIQRARGERELLAPEVLRAVPRSSASTNASPARQGAREGDRCARRWRAILPAS